MKATLVIVIELLLVGMLASRVVAQPVKPVAERIHVLADYQTIQSAINSAVPGDTVLVQSGVYYEHVIVNKSISLVGQSRDTTIVDGNGTGTVISIIADFVSVINLTIRNAGREWGPPPGYGYPDSLIQGRTVSHVGVVNNILAGAAVCVAFTDYSSQVSVSGNLVINATYIGVLAYSSFDVIIDQNTVYDYGSEGIHLDGGSTNSKITNNTVKNGFAGISLEKLSTTGNLIQGNHLCNNSASIGLYGAGPNVFRQNNMNSHRYNLLIWGYDLNSFMQDIDDSNTANNKTIYFMVNAHNLVIDPASCPNLGYLAIVNSSNVTARNFTISENGDGILLASSTNCTLTNIALTDNHGPLIYGGLMLFESDNNTIVDNRISENDYGILFYHSDRNLFYRNSFVNNKRHVVSDFLSPLRNMSSGYDSSNYWNTSYPFGGNYWSDYNGLDQYGGAQQNETGKDGIGDKAYVIDKSNRDNYPLVKPYVPLLCDLNYDRKVDIKDLFIAALAFGTYFGFTNWNGHADLNRDGRVDIIDLVLIAKSFGATSL